MAQLAHVNHPARPENALQEQSFSLEFRNVLKQQLQNGAI